MLPPVVAIPRSPTPCRKWLARAGFEFGNQCFKCGIGLEQFAGQFIVLTGIQRLKSDKALVGQLDNHCLAGVSAFAKGAAWVGLQVAKWDGLDGPWNS